MDGVTTTVKVAHVRLWWEQTLVEEVAAWGKDRNTNHAKANWHFTTPNARIELKHLYPSI
jgi:hypothetical protein